MLCTDVVDEFYNKIAGNYKKYIGQTVEHVSNDLKKTHIVKPYKIKDLQNDDVILWQNKKDKNAHITVYRNFYIYYSSLQKIKSKPILLSYKNMLIPKYIVRLEK